MLATAFCLWAASRQQIPKQHEAPMTRVPLVLYQEKNVYLNGMQPVEGTTRGPSVTLTCVGSCNWVVEDGGVRGVPCKMYTADGAWAYKAKPKKGKFTEDRNAKFSMSYEVGLDGIPIHSESHFEDVNDYDYRTIDIEADYRKDHIDEKITRDGYVERKVLFPSFGMEEFAGMFEPVMSQGLIQQPVLHGYVIHPYTGAPYPFTVRVTGRFTGDFLSLQQAGYRLEVSGDEGTDQVYLSRQGQLLKVDLPNRTYAFQLEEPLAPERQGWGSFHVSDWQKSTDVTNPERPVYHTWIVPVMFKNPKILIPVPCALTD